MLLRYSSGDCDVVLIFSESVKTIFHAIIQIYKDALSFNRGLECQGVDMLLNSVLNQVGIYVCLSPRVLKAK